MKRKPSAPKPEEGGYNFMVTTGYGARTQKPFVQMTEEKNDFSVQMSPQEAIDLAHSLMAAADAATTDAFIITFFRSMSLEDAQVFAFLQEFRAYREAQEK